MRLRKVSCFSPLSCALGVSQDEETFAFMRRTDFFRRKQSRLNAVTHLLKVIMDLFKPQS